MRAMLCMDIRNCAELLANSFRCGGITRKGRLCKMSKVCLADGRWYADLDERLADSTYRVPRKTIKDDHEILKFCMLHACRYSVG